MARTAALPLAAVLLATAGCLPGSPERPLGSSCASDESCAAGLVCAYGRCRSACSFDADCPDGVCVDSPTGRGRVCTLSDEGGEGGCPEGLELWEGSCREPCYPDCEADGDADLDLDADADVVLDADESGDAEPDGTAPDADRGVLDADAPSEPVAVNLLLPANGGVLVSPPTSYCPEARDCLEGELFAENLTDGEYAAGTCEEQYPAVWASASMVPSRTGQTMVFEFGGGGARAALVGLVVQNWGGEGGCFTSWIYSSRIEVLVDEVSVLRHELAQDLSIQELDLTAGGAPRSGTSLTLRILEGCTIAWDCTTRNYALGEVEAWGWLEPPGG